MKFKITFKDPDAVSEAISYATDKEVKKIMELTDLLTEEDDLRGLIYSKLEDSLVGFVDFGDYITVEFDTELNTATVVKS